MPTSNQSEIKKARYCFDAILIDSPWFGSTSLSVRKGRRNEVFPSSPLINDLRIHLCDPVRPTSPSRAAFICFFSYVSVDFPPISPRSSYKRAHACRRCAAVLCYELCCSVCSAHSRPQTALGSGWAVCCVLREVLSVIAALPMMLSVVCCLSSAAPQFVLGRRGGDRLSDGEARGEVRTATRVEP